MLPRDFQTTNPSLFLRLNGEGPAREFAWHEFYKSYAPIIGGFARKMGAPAADIEDIVQEVIMGFFAVAPEFVYDPARGRFRGYLKTCAWRKLQRQLGATLLFSGIPIEDVADDDAGVEAIWADLWKQEALQHALEMVRRQYTARQDQLKTFEAFERYALLQQPADEVAAALQMTAAGVHQAKSRITRALRETMDALDTFAD